MALKRKQKIISKSALTAVRDYADHIRKSGITLDKVYIYGSRSRGENRKNSDIDVALVSSDFKDNFEALEYLWIHLRDKDVKKRIEPVGFSPKTFNPAASPLALAVIDEGIEVKV